MVKFVLSCIISSFLEGGAKNDAREVKNAKKKKKKGSFYFLGKQI